jgi:hypothetical protein
MALCLIEVVFLILTPLHQPWIQQPSGSKIASGAAFSWLLPLVIPNVYYGVSVDPTKTGEEIMKLLNALEGEQHSEGSEGEPERTV